MVLQFDPNVGPRNPGDPSSIEGAITALAVIDPQPFNGGTGNHVVDPAKPFTLRVAWEVFGQLAPLFLDRGAPTWLVRVYAESIGPGDEIELGRDTTVARRGTAAANPDPVRPNRELFTVDLVVPANLLKEDSAGNSGIYKLIATVFLNSRSVGSPGYDLTGFFEGPIIQVESP
ncbi:hypothetical protein [Cryptosporangium arvum]|uniref:hypothetical protein n=1 Tax=Cryptosporangium arvum TaxID=80871 RepID=UPI0004B4E2C1|nr:hypothetical protein [Cryptosporangium arvum]